MNTPKVVSGIDARQPGGRATASTTGSSTRPCRCRRPKEAELTKLLENTFRHVNIALVNELAMFAHDLGIDVWEAIDAALHQAVRLHAVHARARASAATACPVDPSYLSWQVKRRLGHSFRFVELANDVNEHMPDYVVRRGGGGHPGGGGGGGGGGLLLLRVVRSNGRGGGGRPRPAASPACRWTGAPSPGAPPPRGRRGEAPPRRPGGAHDGRRRRGPARGGPGGPPRARSQGGGEAIPVRARHPRLAPAGENVERL